jgi:phage gp16-like protein
MSRKRYEIKTACPQCGCSELTVLSKEEMEKRFGHVHNFAMECGKCMAKYTEKMKDVCPEWDKECQLKK